MICEQDSDDCWNLYNLVSVGDFIQAVAFRKIQLVSATGVTKNEKKKITLCIKVSKFDYDSEADLLRFSGQVAQENKYVALGSYQSIVITPPKALTLIKKQFDYIHVKKIMEMT